ncbi:FtsW/RodA/SpoVE family cell cycle protein [Pseudoneobacillus sp. C159]
MIKKMLKSYDFSLLITIILLSLFSLVMIYSASMVSTIQRYGYPSDFYFEKQKFILVGAVFVFLFFAIIPYRWWAKRIMLIANVIASLGLLILVFFIGDIRGGAQSWIDVGPVSIQPSEFIKTSVIIYLSAVYAKKQSYINEFNRGIAPPLLFLIIAIFLIVKQPDYGTAGIIGLIAASIILSSGMNMKNMAKLFVIGGIGIFLLLFITNSSILTEEQMSRFTSRSNPFADAGNDGWHLVNSYIAIGSGGVNGVGLGKSVQKLGYLPESHTDFIIAVIAEELGLWGVGFVILSLGYIVLRGLRLAMRCQDPFGSLLAIGVSSMIGIQTFINLGGVSGLIPLTGVPLPFISYGGSSFWQLSIAAGLLLNVSRYVNYDRKYKNPQTDWNKSTKKNLSSNKTISY